MTPLRIATVATATAIPIPDATEAAGDTRRFSAVPEHPVSLGGIRGPEDGCRRYRPIHVSYDSRNLVLDLEIQDEWTSDVKALWERNQAKVRAELLGELGPIDAERKLDNYRAMGPAP